MTMRGQSLVGSSAEDLTSNSHSTDTGESDRPGAGGNLTPHSVKRRLMLADAAAVAAGLMVAFACQRVFKPVPIWIVREHMVLIAASLPGFVAGAAMNRLYQARANERVGQEQINVLRTIAVGVGFMVTVAFTLKYETLSRFWVFLVFTCTLAALLAERAIARRVFRRLRASHRMRRRIVIVGTDPHAIGLLHTYQRSAALGYDVVGFVGDDDIGERGGVRVLGRLDEIESILEDHRAVGVVVSLASVNHDRVNTITRRLTDAGYHVALSSCLRDIDIARLRPQELDGRTMIYVEPVVRDGVPRLAKRVFDVALASLILLITAPLWLAAMVAIKLDTPGPILFRQKRIGRDGIAFTLTKFRTMVVDAEDRKAELLDRNEVDGPLFKMSDDPRVTRVGRLLRKFSIDELPQLIAVFRGEMSMVGPRPALPDEVDQWEPELRDRLRVLPGLTGMWQVSGRSGSTFEQYKRLDLYYVDNWSLVHDLRICARTVGVVLTGRGAA